MEGQSKPNKMGGEESSSSKLEAKRPSYDIPIRVLGLVLTLVVAVMVGVDEETKIIPITIVKTLPPLQIPVTAKWHYMSTFVYLLVSNAIASSYAAGSLIYSICTRNVVKDRNPNTPLLLIFLDMVIACLLFTADGATAAIGIIGLYGNSHTKWNKICNVFRGYCNHMAAAVVLSLVGSFVFLLLVALAVFNLNRKSMP